jgi:hypothetical protein
MGHGRMLGHISSGLQLDTRAIGPKLVVLHQKVFKNLFFDDCGRLQF